LALAGEGFVRTITIIMTIEICGAFFLLLRLRTGRGSNALQSAIAFLVSFSAALMVVVALVILFWHHTGVVSASDLWSVHAWVLLALLGFAIAGIAESSFLLVGTPSYVIAFGTLFHGLLWQNLFSALLGVAVLVAGVGTLWISRRVASVRFATL
jgi:hypothetical protein